MKKIINELKIHKIFLMIGPACNFHCRYCLQTPIKNNVQDVKISPELYTYIDHLIDTRPEEEKQIRIIFWGGEPLLYWHIIQEFVLHYQDKLNYGMISNGSLLTQDKIDFLNEHHIGLTLSHDGPNTEQTRNIDVLKDEKLLPLIEQLNPVLNAVISGANADYDALYDYWDKEYPHMGGHVEMLRVTWDMPEDLRNVDLDEYRNGLKRLFANGLEKIKTNEWGSKASEANMIIDKVLRSIEKKPYHFPKCHQVERVLNVDLDGNLYVCHNSHIKIGHVKDARADYLERYYQWLETRKKPECETCEAKHFCQGGCPLDISNEACALQKIMYEEALIAYEKDKETWDKILGR